MPLAKFEWNRSTNEDFDFFRVNDKNAKVYKMGQKIKIVQIL